MPRNENYITLMGWMVNDLHLKGNELIVYAAIYGFSQDGVGEFAGSLSYLSDWLNITRQTVINTLNSLVQKGFLIKNKQIISGVQIVRYKARIPDHVVSAPEKKNKSAIDYQGIVDDYNRTCVSLPKCVKLSNSRRTAIEARLKSYTPEELHRVFQKAEDSAFLSGRKSDFQATFDWLMKDSNTAKVLDGNYDDRKVVSAGNQPSPDAPLADWEKDWLRDMERAGKGVET